MTSSQPARAGNDTAVRRIQAPGRDYPMRSAHAGIQAAPPN